MATYDKCIFNIPPYQEGNKADFTFDLDTNFPVEEIGDITFQVRNSLDKEVFSKKKSTGGITLTERVVSVFFTPADTKGKAGTHYYELDFKDASDNPFATIGGTFTINKEINTL